MRVNQLGGRRSATEVEVHFIHLHFFNQAVELFGQFPLGDPAVVLRLQLRGHFPTQFAKQGTPLAFRFVTFHLGIFLLLMATGNACYDLR
ncbi:hypothetical protein D3C78_1439880 [compost metagenome]